MSDLTLDQQQDMAKFAKVHRNATIVTNILELTVGVVGKVAGKDVSDTVKGETLSRGVLTNLVASRLKDRLMQRGAK